ncbi:cyclic AMP-dependent transcription factor ATF-2 isoform X4 [Stegostoma tigrinum]|uniref:cyclic AMP-dependent transcription factor ATF-2 isoform X4 n=1 Tax=Stegostoma tigrinum TaxID=3053191 RepID=UPI00202B3059|nr:cyclic AMP-dependent transcription factor ATF-2 isoform X4 [Stegostoma tigrinum]
MSDDKPFVCTAPGCGQRFTNEDHLAVHKHKHEMTLKFGPARNDSVIVADQTPTPTRFLKNCEEVGLFNELASPFENEFKKASEDDIKKMPLDMSPLVLPAVRTKVEDMPIVETTHQNSPLPHPESTTSDEKDAPLQQTQTVSTIRPASLQVPNVLLANSETGVVIQQALPSPTSTSVITQTPPTNRNIVPVSGSVPLLLQLPNGQTMPVTIPASITNPSVRIHTTVPIIRPVTMVPNIPGIPGPPVSNMEPSSPQPLQSEAKLRLKAALTQQLPQVTNGNNSIGQTSGTMRIQTKETHPQSLQEAATSTTQPMIISATGPGPCLWWHVGHCGCLSKKVDAGGPGLMAGPEAAEGRHNGRGTASSGRDCCYRAHQDAWELPRSADTTGPDEWWAEAASNE